MKKFLIALLALSGCICDRKKEEATASIPESTTPKVVNLYIWSDYTSPEVLKEFEQATGMKVQESNFSSNEELLAKLQAGASGYDVIIPSDYMISAMKKMALLEPLDKSKIPNASKINPQLLSQAFDPKNEYSFPYSWGVSGIAYNKAKLKTSIKGWKDLLANAQAKHRMSMLDDGREALSAALRMNGFSVNTTDKTQLEKAKKTLIDLKKNLKSFTSTPLPSLVSGELLAAHMYSNEAFMAAEKTNGQIEFVFPAEGGVRNIDNFAIPKGAPNPDGAHKLIDFLLTPKAHASFVNRLFAGPVLIDMNALLSDEMKKNPLVIQFDFIANSSEMLKDLEAEMAVYDRIWTEVKAAR